MKLLVTGFGPFLSVTENPSAWIAERLGVPFRVLDVSYRAVDEFLGDLESKPPAALMMIGVAAKRRRICLERVGSNWAGTSPDVEGVVRGPASIDLSAAAEQHATLWRRGDRIQPARMAYSLNAGDYLCNYSLHEAARRLPATASGFLHIPPFDAIPREEQLDLITRLTQRIIARFQ